MRNNAQRELIPMTVGTNAQYLVGSATYYYDGTNYENTYVLFGTAHHTIILGVYSNHPIDYEPYGNAFVLNWEFASTQEVMEYIQTELHGWDDSTMQELQQIVF